MEGGRAGQDAVVAAFEGLKKQAGGRAASGIPQDTTLEVFRAVVEGGEQGVAAELYPGLMRRELGVAEYKQRVLHPFARYLTDAEIGNAKRIAGLIRAVASGYVRQTREIMAGQDHVGSTETLNEPTPPLSEQDLMMAGLGFEPTYPAQPGQRIVNSVNNYNTQNQGTVYNAVDLPSRQREQKFRFSLGEIDIKPPQ
jgi:hypothetical protein